MRPMPFCGTCRLGLDFQNDSDMMRVRIVKRGLAVHLSQHLVDKIRSIAEKYEIQKIILFGSRAREDNRARSDIDLAVFSSDGFDRHGLFACEIDDLNTLLKIDIVFISSNTEMDLIKTIEEEGVVLYERP